MAQPHTVLRPGLSAVKAFLTKHPRAVVAVVLLGVVLGSQGAASAETASLGELSLVEPNAGHGASTGP